MTYITSDMVELPPVELSEKWESLTVGFDFSGGRFLCFELNEHHDGVSLIAFHTATQISFVRTTHFRLVLSSPGNLPKIELNKFDGYYYVKSFPVGANHAVHIFSINQALNHCTVLVQEPIDEPEDDDEDVLNNV